jgi:ribosome-binding factor A
MSNNSRRAHTRKKQSDSYTSNIGDQPEEGLGHRQSRLEHILRDEIQSLLRDEVTDPTVEGVAVLAVHLSPDGGHARVAYAVIAPLDGEQKLRCTRQAGLVRVTGFLRARLAHQLDLKKLPKLTFTFVGILQSKASSDAPGDEPCPE